MEVIILAGGLGGRLRSVVNEVPKCMAPIADKPFLWYLLQYLSHYEISKIILSVGYLREIIFRWIDDVGKTFPFDFDYAIEESPMGTGGGIRLAMEKVREDEAIILNGDTFFDIDLRSLLDKHDDMKASLSVALKPMVNFNRYGNVRCDDSYIISAFEEKKECMKGFINGGTYVLNRNTLFFEGLSGKFSFETDVLGPFCKKGLIHGFPYNAYFIDIGVPEDYQKANEELINLFY